MHGVGDEFEVAMKGLNVKLRHLLLVERKRRFIAHQGTGGLAD